MIVTLSDNGRELKLNMTEEVAEELRKCFVQGAVFQGKMLGYDTMLINTKRFQLMSMKGDIDD